MAMITVNQREYWIVNKRACAIGTLRAVASAIMFFFLLWITRSAWLTAMSIYLMRGESPRPADALIVLSGGPGDRARYGAQLFMDGYAQTVLTAGDPHIPGTPAFDAQYEMGLLELFGIPADNIATLGTLGSTLEEAERSREWLLFHKFDSLIVVSDPYHLRRASHIFGSVFRGTGIDLNYVATEPSWFISENWWKRDAEFDVVVSEYIKMANTLWQLAVRHYRL